MEARGAAELRVSRQAQPLRSLGNYGEAASEDSCDRGRQESERERVDCAGCPCQRDRAVQEGRLTRLVSEGAGAHGSPGKPPWIVGVFGACDYVHHERNLARRRAEPKTPDTYEQISEEALLLVAASRESSSLSTRLND